jgi:hypothetical protein
MRRGEEGAAARVAVLVPVVAAAVEAEAGEAAARERVRAEALARAVAARVRAQAPVGERDPAAAPGVLPVQEAAAVDPVRVQELAQASVSEPDPVRRWAQVSVPAPMPRSVPARTPLLALARMRRWAPGRMLQQLQRPKPAPGLGRDRPPAMGPAMEAAIRELALKTAPVLEPLHSVRRL